MIKFAIQKGTLASMKQTGTMNKWERAKIRVTVSQDCSEKQLKIISNIVKNARMQA